MTETHVALASGGMDSAIASHIAVRWGPADILVYLDTRTGLDENREYVERLADRLGVQLWTLRTHNSYAERVRERGFPGPSIHQIFYNILKDRQIQKLATVADELHCWTGIRARESQKRMRIAEPEGDRDGGRWFWHSPIHDWTKADCEAYLDEFDLPENPLWSTLGRSGDCFCGCFGSPEELLDLEAAGCGYLADWLRELEDDVDRDDEKGRWAWGAMSRPEVRAERLDDLQMTLCSACGIPEPAESDGGEPETVELLSECPNCGYRGRVDVPTTPYRVVCDECGVDFHVGGEGE